MSSDDIAQHLVVLTTLADTDSARTLIRELIDRKLIACGTVFEGARSIYRWNDEVTEEMEVVVLLKTRHDRWTALEQAVRTAHPYAVPELLALPVVAGAESYLDWVTTEVSSQ